jgi:import inner membrane translocase subunit TIM54
MMGLPNLPKKLPSRNWMIFFTITGSFTAAVVYDKREKRRAQRKWCKLVEHLAKEPLDAKVMPRRLTIFLEGPPGDGLRIAQEHFKEYVKPILVSSGLDWEFIQGRKEGDVRAELAEKIRAFRLPPDEGPEEEDVIARIRRQNSIAEFDAPRGDIVIGRHTWKEYIRGLHEGWLGPLKEPTLSVPEKPADFEKPAEPEKAGESEDPFDLPKVETLPGITVHSVPVDQTPPTEGTSEDPTETPSETPKKPPQPAPFISTADYQSASLPPKLPQSLDPSVPIPLPHILGLRNTPLRLYRFLNRRELADSIGRDTAAIILASTRPYHTVSTAPGSSFAPTSDGTDGVVNDEANKAEQATVLELEEKEWHKSVKKREEGEKERTWLEDVVLDPRIAERMLRAELSSEEETRARAIVVPEEEVEGWIKGGVRSLYRAGKAYFTAPKPTGPNVGNIDDESV